MRPLPIPDSLLGAFPGSTRHVLAPPSGDMVDDAEVGSLEIIARTLTLYDGEAPALTSAWLPDAAELEALAAGGFLTLTIIGPFHPPVSLDVWQAFEVEAEQVDPDEAES